VIVEIKAGRLSEPHYHQAAAQLFCATTNYQCADCARARTTDVPCAVLLAGADFTAVGLYSKSEPPNEQHLVTFTGAPSGDDALAALVNHLAPDTGMEKSGRKRSSDDRSDTGSAPTASEEPENGGGPGEKPNLQQRMLTVCEDEDNLIRVKDWLRACGTPTPADSPPDYNLTPSSHSGDHAAQEPLADLQRACRTLAKT
jgi:hypothetical protein